MITLNSNNTIFDIFEDLKNEILKSNRTLLEALTGSGKTYFSIKFLEYLLQQNPNQILVMSVDTIDLAKQIANTYSIFCITGETDIKIKQNIEFGIYVSTYDSLKHFKKKGIDFLIIDEAHQLVSASTYREAATAILNYWMSKNDTKVLCITATPYYLFPLTNTYNHIKVNTPTTLIYKYCLVKLQEINVVKAVLNIIKNNQIIEGNKIVVYVNNTKHLEAIQLYLKEMTNYKTVLIQSTAKDDFKNSTKKSNGLNHLFIDENFNNLGITKPENLLIPVNQSLNKQCLDSILKKELIPNSVDIVLCTSVLQNGININNTDIQYIITSELESVDLTQFKARFRKGILDKIYLINSNSIHSEPKKLDYTDYVTEQIKWQAKANELNVYGSSNEIDIKISKSDHKHIIKKDSNSLYYVDLFGVASEIYKYNRINFKSNPLFFFEIDEYSLGINLIINDEIDKKLKQILSKGFEVYQSDYNIIEYNKVLKLKKSGKHLENSFYVENQLMFINKKVKQFNIKYLMLVDFFKSINFKIDFEVLKNMVFDNKTKSYYQYLIMFNYLETYKKINITNAKNIWKNINLKDSRRLELLKEIKNIMLSYSNRSLEYIKIKIYVLSKLRLENDVRILKHNDNLFSEILNQIFTVSKKRVPELNDENKKVKTMKYKLEEFSLNEKFKGVFESIDSLNLVNTEIKSLSEINIGS